MTTQTKVVHTTTRTVTVNTVARDKVIAAKTALVLDAPFFGALALRLAMREDTTCETAWTDGRSMGYSPTFVESLTQRELIGLLAHEVMHCANGHPWRRSGRAAKKWNEACDYAINGELTAAKFSLPKGGLLDPQYSGHASEWIYDRLPDGGEGGGDGDGEPGSEWGEVRDAPSDGDDTVSEADWQKAVQQSAMAAKARGNLPASLDRFAKQAAEPRVDWRSALRRFVQQTAHNDYTWRKPSRRYMARGLYMPSLHSEEVGKIVAVVDTSGSIDDVLLSQFAGEINAIAQDVNPSSVVVIYCDADIGRVDEFDRGEPIVMKPCGGGGTDFRPPFEHVAKMDEPPVCLVYLTDLAGCFPETAPEVPTLWASTTRGEAPFGETIYVGT